MAQSYGSASGLLASTSAAEAQLFGRVGERMALADTRVDADPLSDVLRMVRLTGALFFMVDASHPWGVEVPRADRFASIVLPRAQHVISYHIVLKGRGWAGIPGTSSTWFETGDILVFPHADPYFMLSQPGQSPEYDAEATVQFFREMVAGNLPFVIEEGGGGEERTQFVCGYLGCDTRPFNPVLTALPPLLRVRRAATDHTDLLDSLIELTLAEAQKSRPGGECIRLKLSELIFVEVVRRYLETLSVDQHSWLAGLRDPIVGRALAELHKRSSYQWTLQELAEASGVSRSVLAERFAQLVGTPPMQYLTLWRIQMAARLLADGTTKIAAIGHQVGYESEAAFSRAFRRVTGVAPAKWRASARATPSHE